MNSELLQKQLPRLESLFREFLNTHGQGIFQKDEQPCLTVTAIKIAPIVVIEQSNQQLDDLLSMPLKKFDLSIRQANALFSWDYKIIGDVVRQSDSYLRHMRNFGEFSLRTLKEKLELKGLEIGRMYPARGPKERAMFLENKARAPFLDWYFRECCLKSAVPELVSKHILYVIKGKHESINNMLSAGAKAFVAQLQQNILDDSTFVKWNKGYNTYVIGLPGHEYEYSTEKPFTMSAEFSKPRLTQSVERFLAQVRDSI
jgi:hypothetical protein